jgi:hypothetical protein
MGRGSPGLWRPGISIRPTLGHPCAGARGSRRAEGAVPSRGRPPHRVSLEQTVTGRTGQPTSTRSSLARSRFRGSPQSLDGHARGSVVPARRRTASTRTSPSTASGTRACGSPRRYGYLRARPRCRYSARADRVSVWRWCGEVTKRVLVAFDEESLRGEAIKGLLHRLLRATRDATALCLRN